LRRQDHQGGDGRTLGVSLPRVPALRSFSALETNDRDPIHLDPAPGG
jgi:hypothetical protein